MVRFAYDDIAFVEHNDQVRALFLDAFFFSLEKEELLRIGDYEIKDKAIVFSDDASPRMERRFSELLSAGFLRLRSMMYDKPACYIHRESGIPLMGSNAFGLIDRGTNIIEVRPMTGCNLCCIYCSVNNEKRQIDFVVEADYIIQEFKKLADYKGVEGIEAHIGPQGEPLLYKPLSRLIEGISSIPNVSTISIDTNATLLTTEKIDELVRAGLTRFNVSLNAMTPDKARKIAGRDYDLTHVLRCIEHISEVADLIIAPVLIPGHNEEDIEKIVEFVRSLRPKERHSILLGIQNYLTYKHGRNPTRPWKLETFFSYLDDLEQRYGMKLRFSQEDFKIIASRSYPKPFRKDQIIEAEVVCEGRMANEKLAVADGWVITVGRCRSAGRIRVKISRSKHNIFYGYCV